MNLLRLLFVGIMLAVAMAIFPFLSTASAESASSRHPAAASLEEGRARMKALVERFKSDTTAHELLEKDTRKFYLDEFLRCLGWDSGNDEQSELYRQDTIPEAQIFMSRSTRYIDYKQKVDSEGFVLEAKRVKVNCDLKPHRFQTKRYTWSTMQTEVGVLTNFRQFRVFDARRRPHFEKPDEGEIQQFHLNYTDYVEKFGLLWNTFSKESVKSGSLKKLLQKVDPRMVRKDVDSELTEHMNALRLELARDLIRKNPELSEPDLNIAVHNILNRLLFTRILEDRDIEPSGILRQTVLHAKGDRLLKDGRKDYASSPNGIYAEIIRELRSRLYLRYRGSLFRDHPSDRLNVSDDVIEKIVMSLYPADEDNPGGSGYDFRVVPLEVIGNVYQSFLGNRIVHSNGVVSLEKSPSVREAGGVFYTPDNIARFLTEHTLRDYIRERNPDELTGLRIVDPASGCGALLAQAALALFEQARTWYAKHPDQIGRKDYEFPDAIINQDGSVKLSPFVKARLVRNCLYGVDVDRQAIEIASMWLYILILDGENFSVVDDERRARYENRSWKLNPMFKLPDLRDNLVVGNALLEPDYSGSDKDAACPFDWRENPTAIGNVVQNGGFDIVLMNPPYIGFQKMTANLPEQLAYLRKKYRGMSKYQVDMAYAFIERGSQLLNKNGKLGCIVTNSLLTFKAAEELRKLLVEQNLLDEFINFERVRVFSSAKVHTALMFLRKNRSGDVKTAKLLDPDLIQQFLEDCAAGRENSKNAYFVSRVPIEALKGGKWVFSNPKFAEYERRMKAQKFELNQLFHAFSGLSHGNSNVFLLEIDEERENTVIAKSKAAPKGFEIEKELVKPVPPRGLLKRYENIPFRQFILFPYDRDFGLIDEELLQEKYPHAYAYLQANKKSLETSTAKAWYAFSRSNGIAYSAQPKLYVGMDYVTTIDPRGQFVLCSSSYAGVVPQQDQIDLWMLMGILNSSMVREYAASTTGHFGSRVVVRIGDLRKIPIPEFNARTAPFYRKLGAAARALNGESLLPAPGSLFEYQSMIEQLVWELYEAGAQMDNRPDVKVRFNNVKRDPAVTVRQ